MIIIIIMIIFGLPALVAQLLLAEKKGDVRPKRHYSRLYTYVCVCIYIYMYIYNYCMYMFACVILHYSIV